MTGLRLAGKEKEECIRRLKAARGKMQQHTIRELDRQAGTSWIGFSTSAYEGPGRFEISSYHYHIEGQLMASTEKEIDSLARMRSYGSREAVISDAVRALLVLKPGLKMEVALDLYKNGEVSLWRAAEMAGLSLEEFKELLASRSIRIEVGASNEESLERLSKAGLL